jgi:hypothetical protein
MNDRSPSPAPDEIEAIAGLDFPPWSQSAGDWTPPSNADWSSLADPHLISVRVAWLMMHKSKDELVALANQLGDDGVRELVTEIGRTTDWFESLHGLLLAAECRIMCAYAAVAVAAEECADASWPPT